MSRPRLQPHQASSKLSLNTDSLAQLDPYLSSNPISFDSVSLNNILNLIKITIINQHDIVNHIKFNINRKNHKKLAVLLEKYP
jgi:hypothetical protein